MKLYLSQSEVADAAEQLRTEFAGLLQHLARRPGSKQWKFFRHCLDVAIGGKSQEYLCDKLAAAQYRFEVEDRLIRYYQSGISVPFSFTLMHEGEAAKYGYADKSYPRANGYLLMVIDNRRGGEAALNSLPVADVLEGVVASACHAEWAVYAKLPKVDLTPLDRAFVRDGPAYKHIRLVAERHRKRRWTISNPGNPSTQRLLEMKIKKIGRNQATVRTTEYWFLRWWSCKTRDYARIEFQGITRNTYLLAREDERWLVEDNIYPNPREAIPIRKSPKPEV